MKYLTIISLLMFNLLLTKPVIAQSDQPLFSYDGFDYGVADLQPNLRQSYFDAAQAFYKQQQQIADLALFELYIEDLANKQKRSKDAITKKLLKIDLPNKTEIKAFYEQNKARITQPLDQVGPRIASFLIRQRVLAKRSEVLARIKIKNVFKLRVAAPKPAVFTIDTHNMPTEGSADAPVTIVEFADYQCPHCLHAVAPLQKVLKHFGDKVKLVYADFPINPSGISRKIAEGAFCAGKQDKYWEYHRQAFALQDQLSKSSAKDLAMLVGLDEKQFSTCQNDSKAAAYVQRSFTEGQRIGVSGTPTIFVNGRKVTLYDVEKDVSNMIERLLKMRLSAQTGQ